MYITFVANDYRSTERRERKKKKGEKTLRFHSIQVVRVLIIYSRTIGIITCRRYSPYGRRQGRFIQIVVLSPYDTNEFTVSISNDGKKSRKKKKRQTYYVKKCTITYVLLAKRIVLPHDKLAFFLILFFYTFQSRFRA